MARYTCRQNKAVTIKKANEYCILHRCPDLMVQRFVVERRRLKYFYVQVVSESMSELAANIECEK